MHRKAKPQVAPRSAGTFKRMPPKATKPKRRSIGRPADDLVGEERLIAVTVDLLKTTSPAQLNRLEIARAAGVDPALIRYYFGTKDKLLARAVVALTEEIVAGASTHIASQGSARVRLETYVRAFFGSVTAHPRYHELVLQQVFQGTSKRAQELRAELRRVGQAALRSIIDQGIAEGEFRDVDARFLEIALLGVSNYIVSAWPLFEDMFRAEGDRRSVVDRYLAFVIEMIFAHVAVRPLLVEAAAGPKATGGVARERSAGRRSR